MFTLFRNLNSASDIHTLTSKKKVTMFAAEKYIPGSKSLQSVLFAVKIKSN